MGNLKDYSEFIGQKCHKLTIEKIERDIINKYIVLCSCKCDCGKYTKTELKSLKKGHTKSCGCYHKEVKEKNRKDFSYLIGRSFGRLIIKEIIRYQIAENISPYCVCECSCGNVKNISLGAIVNGRTRSCGCLFLEERRKYRRDYNDLINKKFGRLTVKNIERKKNSDNLTQIYCICECLCGTVKSIILSNLIYGSTVSCGCYNLDINFNNNASEITKKYRGILDKNGKTINGLIWQYKKGASKRRYIWNLTDDYVAKLTLSDCYYCGIEPNPYNGIDRVNNSKGYTIDNCVSCCKICNFSKRAMSKEDFLDLIKKINNKSHSENIILINFDKSIKIEKRASNSIMKNIGRYKRGSQYRNHCWELTDDYAKTLMINPCYYCGLDPIPSFAGIDRSDNYKGYTVDNCVPCCKTCNFVKHTLSKDNFLCWAKRVYEHTDLVAEHI
jgi:hypothetical protein